VSSTSPSGTIATVPATAPDAASRHPPRARIWLKNSRVAVGTIRNVTYTRIRSMPARSSDRVSVKRRASSAIRTA
jgi:hypothetical protein